MELLKKYWVNIFLSLFLVVGNIIRRGITLDLSIDIAVALIVIMPIFIKNRYAMMIVGSVIIITGILLIYVLN